MANHAERDRYDGELRRQTPYMTECLAHLVRPQPAHTLDSARGICQSQRKSLLGYECLAPGGTVWIRTRNSRRTANRAGRCPLYPRTRPADLALCRGEGA